MNREFKSGLAAHISSFIALKKSLGFPYESNTRILLEFDAMIAESFPDADTVTKEISDAWIKRRSSHPKSLEHNVCAVRQFSKYIKGIGIPAYVTPSGTIQNRVQYSPHIYSAQERISFFSALDKTPFRKVSPTKYYVAPIVFRLLYCCGLRASEALTLKRSEIDLLTGRIVVHESKGWTSRVIYVSEDLLENLNEYDHLMEAMLPNRIPFFPNRSGNFYAEGTLDRWFHEVWDKLPEAQNVTGNSPRVHDWRHTMLTERLNRWVKEGKDINSMYVYLSEYAGHTTYDSTDYYLHLVSSFYPEMEQLLSSVNSEILPEVINHEEYM